MSNYAQTKVLKGNNVVKRGKFVVFDGGEGSGKSSIVRYLVEKALLAGHDVKSTREPGGSYYAEKIRNLILDDEAREADAETLFALFWAARRDHLKRLIIPALERGTHVICDRFDSSTWAYQIVGQQNGQLRHLFRQMRKHYLAKAFPDHYLIMDVDPEIGLARVKSRGDTQTHFDLRELDFHKRVNTAFVDFAKSLPKGQASIHDANLPQDQAQISPLVTVASICWGPKNTW